MSEFRTKLSMSPLPDGLQYALQADLVYQSDLAGLVTVPKQFITDLASIPKALWNVLPPFGTYSAAAVVHDWLFFTKPCTFDVANAVLREAMELLGCDEVTVHMIYTAVDRFGLAAWQRDDMLRKSGYTRMASLVDLPPYAGIPI